MTDVPVLEHKIPLAPFTTFGIGGPADLLTRPQSAEELVAAVRYAWREKLPWFVLGSGANVLVGDKGFRGLVIKNEARQHSLEGSVLTAESGAAIADLIDASTEAGLSGLEHYQDIPSTLGGAIWQNLHFLSYPHKRTYFIAEIVRGARMLIGGEVREVDPAYFEFGYDDSILHRTDDIVLSVRMELTPAPPEEIALRRTKNAAWRAEKHPRGAVRMSAGSIFQKIEGVGAGRLIDQAGLKGRRVGAAAVSDHHANYILNTGGATAGEVRQLIELVQREVKAHSGYDLQTEISFIGEF